MSEVSVVVNKLLNVPIEKVLEHYHIHIAKGRGDRSFCYCPFHKETKPSFMVGGKGNFCYCFSCGKGWDSIKFIQDYEKLDYGKAVKRLSEIADVYVSETDLQEIVNIHWEKWKKTSGVIEDTESFKEKELMDVVDQISTKFTKFYQKFPEWKYFHHYVDYCWSEFDEIVFSSDRITREKLDSVKDWFKKSKSFLTIVEPWFRNFSLDMRYFYMNTVMDTI